MMEEKLIEPNISEESLISKKLDKEMKRELRNSIYREIIGLINEKSIYMLGTEKTKVATVIANYHDDVLKILKSFKESK